MVGLVVIPPLVTSTLVEDNIMIVELVAVLLLVTIAVVEDNTVVASGIPLMPIGISGSAVEQYMHLIADQLVKV